MKTLKTKHFTYILATLCAVMILIMVMIPIINALSVPTFLDINIAPYTASVIINGQEYANGSYEFEAGEYTAEISADGFISKTVNIEVVSREETQLIDYLMPEDGDLSYFEKSETDLETLRSIDDETIQTFLAAYDKKLEIKDLLPLVANFKAGDNITFIKIEDGSSRQDCDYTFCLLANGGLGYESHVAEAIQNAGFEPADYHIIYIDYTY